LAKEKYLGVWVNVGWVQEIAVCRCGVAENELFPLSPPKLEWLDSEGSYYPVGQVNGGGVWDPVSQPTVVQTRCEPISELGSASKIYLNRQLTHTELACCSRGIVELICRGIFPRKEVGWQDSWLD